MNRTLSALIALVVVIVAAAGLWYISRPASEPETVTQVETPTAPAEVDASLPEIPEMTLGNPDAKVTVIEYASFTCPHCRTFSENVFPTLKAEYIDTGKIHFIYREVFFDKYGIWGAMLARCAGPMRYFGMVDLLYEKQPEWTATRNDAGIANDLRKLGLAAGIEQAQLDACMSDNNMAQALVAAYQRNAAADGIDSTPSFVINGKKYTNMAYADFSALLDEKLGE